jgi:hypothetical protein
MTMVAPTLQAFFSDRLAKQLQASPRTIASYRDTLRASLHLGQRQGLRSRHQAGDAQAVARRVERGSVVVADDEELVVGREPRVELFPDQLALSDLRDGVRRGLIQPRDHLAVRVARERVRGPGHLQCGQSRNGCAATLQQGAARDLLIHHRAPLLEHTATHACAAAAERGASNLPLAPVRRPAAACVRRQRVGPASVDLSPELARYLSPDQAAPGLRAD